MNTDKASRDEPERSASALDHDLKDIPPFPYRPLNPTTTEIRLVTILPSLEVNILDIECQLSVTSLDEAPHYEALSYTWADLSGDSSLTSRITLDGCPFLVAKNLATALGQLRLPSIKRVLWIDAICIDQSKDTERSHQVSMMRTIYQTANRVLLWLGVEEMTSYFAFKLLRGVLGQEDADRWLREAFTPPVLSLCFKALMVLFLRPYWNRIWIIQEIASAREITVYCGPYSISWASLLKAKDYLVNQLRDVREYCYIDHHVLTFLNTLGPNSVVMPRNRSTQRYGSLYETLVEFREKVSTDPRDKVYGIAGLTGAWGDARFTIDYSRTVSEVCTDVVKYVVAATQKLDIISEGKDQFWPDWPSWVPNWSEQPNISRRYLLGKGFDAATGSQPNVTFDSAGKVLRVKGIPINVIESVALPLNIDIVQMSPQSPSFYNTLSTICSWHELSIKTADGNGSRAFGEVIGMYAYQGRQDLEAGLLEESQIEHILRSFGLSIKHHMPNYPLNGILADASHGFSGPEDSRNEVPEEVSEWVYRYTSLNSGRRFFVTSSGRMGLAPHIAEKGDIVTVLFGSSHPVILRPYEGYYIVVGDAYVNGLIYGEAMHKLAVGECEVQEFELH